MPVVSNEYESVINTIEEARMLNTGIKSVTEEYDKAVIELNNAKSNVKCLRETRDKQMDKLMRLIDEIESFIYNVD